MQSRDRALPGDRGGDHRASVDERLEKIRRRLVVVMAFPGAAVFVAASLIQRL